MSCPVRSLHKSRTACPSLGPAVPVPLLPGSMKKDFNGHPSITPQLEGYGAPKPSATSNEDPLIAGRMRTFPDNHPSLGSVRNAKSLGCPALIFNQMTSDQWKSTTQAQIGERQPTFKKGRREALTLTRHATKQRTAATYCTTPPTALTVMSQGGQEGGARARGSARAPGPATRDAGDPGGLQADIRARLHGREAHGDAHLVGQVVGLSSN